MARHSHPHSHSHLRLTPIPPHGVGTRKEAKFGKPKRPLGDPVSPPKPTARYISPPATNNTNLSVSLEVLLPDLAEAAPNAAKLVFHAVGDTGGIHGDDVEKVIADAMTNQIEHPDHGNPRPAFYYNLGDVIYFNGESKFYISQFYEPYQNYPAAIFAIAGNHDGDNHARAGDPVDTEPSLYGFMRNFCDSSSHQESPYRATMTQPYVYWVLDAPCATVIGLYSNVDGTLDARGTSEQQQWFEEQMANAPEDKALLIAVHHPPYSLDTVHGGYPDIEIAIDRAIHRTSRVPTAVLSGHVHSYQRFERDIGEKKVAYIIPGAGGYANTQKLMHKIEKGENGQNLPKGFQTVNHPDLKLMAYNDQFPGFLRVTSDQQRKTVNFEYFTIPFDGPPTAKLDDSVTIGW